MIFTTGPEDPLINRQCFCCLICKKNIPMKSRRLYDLKKHFQRNHHSRAYQRFFRAWYHHTKLRGLDRPTLYGSKLKVEKELFMGLDVPHLDHKLPFYYDVIDRKPFNFTSKSSGVLTQMELLLIFLKGGGRLWTVEKYWI